MSILIGTPLYNGWATDAYERSCYHLKKELNAAGIRHDFLRITNESLITRARNVIAASFLKDTDFECLLFIDADIQFDPADVARLWNLCADGADVAAGCYRHKNPDAKLEAWVDGKLRLLSDYSEPFDVDYAGTGFMMIRRRVFEALRKANPEWEYDEGFPTETRDDPMNMGVSWAFFQDPIWNRTHLSEDYFFCKAVREARMKVIMDPNIELKHWGMYPY